MEAINITSPNFSAIQKPAGLTPKELVRKHIADPTHKITEEEFDKLIVGVFANDPLAKAEESNRH